MNRNRTGRNNTEKRLQIRSIRSQKGQNSITLDSRQQLFGPTVETYRRALSQLVGGHHLDIEVFGLRLASRLDEPLQHLEANEDRTQQGHGCF